MFSGLMTRSLFYIIIISQIWLSIGSTCVHLLIPDCEIVEILGEEEKEKEKEIEKEIEKIHDSRVLIISSFKGNDEKSHQKSGFTSLGREHLKNTTPPPEFTSFFS